MDAIDTEHSPGAIDRSAATFETPREPVALLKRTAGAKFRSLCRFGGVAGLGFAASLGLTALFYEMCGLGETLAYGITQCLVFVMNFLLLRWFVFPGSQTGAALQIGQVTASSIAFRFAEYSLFILAVRIAGWHYIPTIVAVQGCMFIVKYSFLRRLFLR